MDFTHPTDAAHHAADLIEAAIQIIETQPDSSAVHAVLNEALAAAQTAAALPDPASSAML